ncbi:MAG: sigma-70 family RNA polymerase sigma factor [Planctomycetes bacterium]|nr:sigma-70 family RNA polymerase sigma factor [Planctomycetota bacterium]
MADSETTFLGGPKPFPETSWTSVQACREGSQDAYRVGLDTLFRKYWGPVYFYIRRNWSRSVEDAKDLTQEFFLNLVERDFVEEFDASRGRFRTFVCAALSHFLCNRARADKARKRRPEGGIVSFDRLREVQPNFDIPAPGAGESIDQLDADWKNAIVAAVVGALRERAARGGKSAFFELFLRYDLAPQGDSKPTYRQLASAVGVSLPQVANGLRWARENYREIFIEELRDQVSSEEDLRAEARDLFGVDL